MNRKIILYIAVSLDGYIADKDGKLDWLKKQDENYTGDYGYAEFMEGIDTVIMGRKTYEQIETELSPENWPYQNLKTYVFTRKEMEDKRGIAFVQKRIEKFAAELKEKSGKDIWLCGGSEIANQMMTKGLIDEYHLQIIPTVLGGGIPLFNQSHPELQLKVENVKEINGVIDIVYSDLRCQK